MRRQLFFLLSFHTRVLSSFSHGFTLIELLIVIALIASLAVALIATVDPFEQLKKGNDATRRSMSMELYNSLVRYYAQKGAFPWGNTAIPAMAASATQMTSTYLPAVVTQGELKTQFLQQPAATLGKLYINSVGGASLSICYLPESKSGGADPNARYNSSGSTSGLSCTGAGATSGASTCYWCIL